MGTSQKKRSFFGTVKVSLFVALAIVVGLPLACAGISLIGRMDPASLIRPSRLAHIHVSDTVRAADRILAHEPLSEVLADPSFASAAHAASWTRESGILRNPIVRFIGRGSLDAGAYSDGSWLAAYDAGFVSPLLRALPLFKGSLGEYGIAYEPDKGRFVYGAGTKYETYISSRANLLIASNRVSRLESALEDAGAPPESAGKAEPAPEKFQLTDSDVSVLVSSRDALAAFSATDNSALAFIRKIGMPDQVEIGISVGEKRLDVDALLAVDPAKGGLSALLGRDSGIPESFANIPSTAQYYTLLSAGTLEEDIAAARALEPDRVDSLVDRAESACKSLFGTGLSDLVYSWTGSEFAVLGLEGKPKPVFAIRVKNEKKRKESFDRIFSSFAVDEDSTVVMDGMSIPRIAVPDYLLGLLSIFGIEIPAPYYAVREGFLFVSESPENLFAVVTALRKNEALPRQETWKRLTESRDMRSSMSLFYSLDRTTPFFLRGKTQAHRVLRVYRQGLASLSARDGMLRVSLSMVSGAGKGLVPVPGFPVELGGRTSGRVDGLEFGKKGQNRLFSILDGTRAISVDPASGKVCELSGVEAAWCVPAPSLKPRDARDPAAWVVSSDGTATLVDGDMVPQAGFPIKLGARVSCQPAESGGKLYLPDANGALNVVDSTGLIESTPLPFAEPLRSPPSFLAERGTIYMAAYPKGFSGKLWLLDADGKARDGWPAELNGIGFGSPVLAKNGSGVLVAFLTQAGDLSVFDAEGKSLSGFPVRLPGVFYSQPAMGDGVFWAVSSDGTLFKVGLDGSIQSQAIPGMTAEEGGVSTLDVDGDRVPEVFAYGDGNLLYGYTASFALLDGFPLPIWGRPYFSDFNRDGKPECSGVGLDNSLRSWQFK